MKARLRQEFAGEFAGSNAILAQMMDYGIAGFGYQLAGGGRGIARTA